MQSSSKTFFSKLKQKFVKEKKQKKELSFSILANQDEFIYDDHVSLYSFSDDITFTKMLKSHKPNYTDNIDIIISCYTD